MEEIADIFVANCSAYVQYGDKQVFIRNGVTTVRAGHPLLEANPGMFSPFKIDYDDQPEPAAPVEQATANPGDKRQVRRAGGQNQS